MSGSPILDTSSRRILRALDEQPRATVAWLADHLDLARGTVQSRVGQLFAPGVLRPPSVAVPPAALGYPIRALITAELDQTQLETAIVALGEIPEVLECLAVAGLTDLALQVVAQDDEDLYRIGLRILRVPGIRRTVTSIVLKDLIGYRTQQLLG